MKIVRIPISQAVPGAISADDVYSSNDQLIISNGTKLTSKIITRLKFYLIKDLNIIVEDADYQSRPQLRKDASYSEVIKDSIEFKKFHTAFVESIEGFKVDLNNIANSDVPIDTNKLLKYTTKILSESRNGIHVFDMLHCMREYDDITYVHSINVAIICNVLGHWLKFSQADIDVLTLSGLLHDIGKLNIPSYIINKQDTLTVAEHSIVKAHTVQGYQLLKNKDIDSRIKFAALMHHERCDGSGYPNSYHRSSINSFAKIVALADVYDAMTSPRVYRAAHTPFETISLFESEGLQKYDPHYIITFLEGILLSYVGNQVLLSNKLIGTIVMINKQALSKPVIQVGDRFIDLSRKTNIVIEALL